MVYAELVGNVSEGKRFYRDFVVLIESFKRKCEDFRVARGLEKEGLIEYLCQMKSGSSGLQHYMGVPPSYGPQ
jgi:hypothetical protein